MKRNESANSAFIESKQILANATFLVHPDHTAPFEYVWQPLLFFSKKLTPAETGYSAFDRKLLVVYTTIRHFRHSLKGRYFFVNTDHKPLTFVMSSVTESPSLRQTRQLAFIAELTTDIRYVKGETNFVADALLRPTVSFIDNTSTINYKDRSTDQALDTEFTRLRHSKSSTMNFKLLKSFYNNLIWCDVSTGHIRPYVTAKFRKQD